MAKKEFIRLFGEQKVRTKWDDEKQKWFFSIVDIEVKNIKKENPLN